MKVKDIQPTLTMLLGENVSFKKIGEALGTSGTNISQRADRDSEFKPSEIEKLEAHFKVKLNDYKPGILSKMKATIDYITSDDVKKYDKKFEKWNKKNYPDVIPDVIPDDLDDLDDLNYSGTTSRYLEEALDFIRVPYYPELEASCGNGIFAPEKNPNADYFPISTKYGLNKRSKYFVINAFGDSMEPTIYDRQYVIFEQWQGKPIIDNRIYFFCFDDKLFIKRLAFNIDEYVVMSDNKKYDTKKIEKLDVNKVIIFGKFKGLIEND